jgi:hypothetical protein
METSPDYDRGYMEGQRVQRDADDRAEQWTNRLIVVAVMLTVITLTLAVAWSINAAQQRDQEVRLACVSEGGVWTTNVCAWSQGAK